MKNSLLFLICFIASNCFSQSINDYKAVIIPVKYEFQKSENQYRLQTKTKSYLQTAGMTGFYAIETIPAEFNDRCKLLYIDVVEDKAFLTTKVFLLFKDCNGKIIYQSPAGKSKEKQFDSAYTEALNEAFKFVADLNYKYNGGSSNTSSITTTYSASTAAVAASPVLNVPVTTENATAESNLNVLYAQSTTYGYQLIDSEPKVIMKLYKTSNPSSFMAVKGTIQGVLVAKENQWFFEYYQNDQLISEKISVKF
ncbi:hypothetical protein [Flavobacterium cellulosilyticum]|uniref:Uncharacterized protein n=1 Tax=Flavobacterium cellulosilyticum TaxID=2541731 RepID=A0A4R5CDE9_9FLAO|nr:hypothetical protein [Flavobacterium cellulosilyticum]TDD96273.1 hypothetical protein E0F76_12315 [Flavobacterium cellulosilyticum]